jgi:glycosyltransferase involved in cell wall biosynthesis
LERKPLHILVVSNTSPLPFVQGSDRDWINLLNAFGAENVRVTWVGVEGSDQLRPYLDERMMVRTLDVDHPCFYDLVPDNAYRNRSNWLWTRIIVRSSLELCRAFFQLRRKLRHDPVDVVVSNSAVVLLGAFFARLTRRPHLWNIKEYLDPKVKGCRSFAKLITRYSSVVIVPSRIIGEAFAGSAVVLADGGDINYIRSRVQSSREEILRSLGLPLELPMVAQVGGLCHRKGQHLTAEAFVRLAGRGGPPTFSLVFFGSGSAAELERLDLILSGAPPEWRAVVGFSTFAQDDFSAMAAADIVVHPSIFNDAFPNAVREAMILGKPVIASNMGGMTDMIVNGESGLLVTPDNAPALAAALAELVARPTERLKLGTAAEVSAKKKFDIQVLKTAFLNLLRELSARHSFRDPAAARAQSRV